ncbi:hypothetical protein [Paraflavitalea pollutisoli]|uniref:hypothetical protein n=1 Tax=Paraflavitalea pollutisoli TaxID=3034143 RepID=UPI0023EDB7E3|nr:hypothetical protein [Paraflavitalea sp. H1-2-19X]
MNYAKVIGSALQLFPKKIQVTLLEPGTDRLLGKCKLPAATLPPAFDRPTTLTINNTLWRVLAASPLSADDFLYSKKLLLHVQPVTQTSPDRFFWPTRCDWEPEVISYPAGLATDEVSSRTDPAGASESERLTLDRRDWLQLQLLPLQQREIVEEALSHIRAILKRESNPLLGYEQQYLRTGIAVAGLSIMWEDFLQQLNEPTPMSLTLEPGHAVRNAFCLRTDSYTYYGLVQDGLITSLGLAALEYVDEELMRILEAFQLELVDWCRVSRLSAEPGDPPKSEAIDW